MRRWLAGWLALPDELLLLAIIGARECSVSAPSAFSALLLRFFAAAALQICLQRLKLISASRKDLKHVHLHSPAAAVPSVFGVSFRQSKCKLCACVHTEAMVMVMVMVAIAPFETNLATAVSSITGQFSQLDSVK